MQPTIRVSLYPNSSCNLSLTLFEAGDLVTSSGNVYNLGDIAWVLASTALVWIMIPGVGFFYSGLLRRKNALSMIYLSMMTVAMVSFQVRRVVHRVTYANTAPVVLLGILPGIQRNR